MDRFSTVQKAWAGRTVICIASGPSLTREQIERVRLARERDAVRVAVVNDNYLVAPWADLIYFADAKWWKWHRERPEFKRFRGEKCTIFNTGYNVDDPEIHMLRNVGNEGLSTDPGALCTGSTTGYQIVNLVAHTGAARILLLGYDGKRGADGRKHHFGDHPDKTEAPYDSMRQRFPTLVAPLKALGVEVINCSPGSAITCFPRAPLEEALGLRIAAGG